MSDATEEETTAKPERWKNWLPIGRSRVTAPTGHPVYEWTRDMGEISGFGGFYETECRKMVVTGLVWLEAQPVEKGTHLSKEQREALSDAILVAHPGCSGWMLGATRNHAEFVWESGWDAYCQQLRERQKNGQ